MQDSLNHYLASLKTYAGVLGLNGSFQWLSFRARRKLRLASPPFLTIHPRILLHPFQIRTGASSDIDVFDQIIMGLEYQALRDLDPRVIFDLGANIGLSSAWFLSHFPNATVFAVEPDPQNFGLCSRNLSLYAGRAHVLLGAAWSKRTMLALSHSSGDGREWASRVSDTKPAAANNEVEAWDIGSLMERSGAKVIDLLKVDIERAELEVFAHGYEHWLPLVRNICIELHDTQCEEVFFAALKGYQYQVSRTGELTICRNLQPISVPRDSGVKM